MAQFKSEPLEGLVISISISLVRPVLAAMTQVVRTVDQNGQSDKSGEWILKHPKPVLTVDIAEDLSVVSASGDDVYLWQIGVNYGFLQGHTNTVLSAKFTKDNNVVSASADKSVALWDTKTLKRLRKHISHSAIVNDVAVAKAGNFYLSGDDDGQVKLWDPRNKSETLSFKSDWAVLAVACGLDHYFSAGTAGTVSAWDPRNPSGPVYELEGHADTVTGLDVFSNRLVSNAMDNTVRVWDARPLSTGPRALNTYAGVKHGVEMSLQRVVFDDADNIYAASSNGVIRWSMGSLSMISGHSSTVTGICARKSLLASASLDKTVRVIHV